MNIIKENHVDVCIVGAGPAGSVLAYLLVKQGISVLILEKEPDFSRDFRGNFIASPSVNLLKKNNLLENIYEKDFLITDCIELYDQDKRILHLDFNVLFPQAERPIDLPQSKLIATIADCSRQFPTYQLLMEAPVTELIQRDKQILGVRCKYHQETLNIHSKLVVGADGRYSTVRKLAGLSFASTTMGRDVVWFKLTKPGCWGNVMRIKLKKANQLTAIPTSPNHLRCGLSIPKGSYQDLMRGDIGDFHDVISCLAPELHEVVRQEIRSFSDLTLLDIFTTKVPTWSLDGLVLIGDAAHTLSPILGQGIHTAIQDAALLAEKIGSELNKEQLCISSQQLKQFCEERQKRVDAILRYQLKQEKVLVLTHLPLIFLRNAMYWLIDTILPIKRKLFKRIFID